MDHLVVAEVNANVGRIGGIGAEENQVSLLQISRGDFRPDAELLTSSSGKRNFQFAENLLNETGTVNAIS